MLDTVEPIGWSGASQTGSIGTAGGLARVVTS